MTDFELTSRIADVARAIMSVSHAIDRNNEIQRKKRVEPIFIFVPSDLKPEEAKRLGQFLVEAFNEASK